MALLICRIPGDTLPTAEEAAASGIAAWLVGAQLRAGGELGIHAPDVWLEQPERSLPFCLEWQLPEALTPREERAIADLLAAWLAHPRYFRWRGQTPLWIADPERLSHLGLVSQRLRLQFGPTLSLWGGGPLGQQLDGRYDRPLRDFPCRAVNAHQRDYGSFLHHAHHRCQPESGAAVIPAVLAVPTGAEQDEFSGATAKAYREWQALAEAWSELRHEPANDGLVLIESWEGHERWSVPGEAPRSPSPPSGPARRSVSQGWGETGKTNPAVLLHGFHTDLLGQMLQELQLERTPPLDLYISTTLEKQKQVVALVKDLDWHRAEVVGVENRGRDIAPFLLELLPRALANGHPWLLKLHTKHSSHLHEGAQWSQHLRRTLTLAATSCRLDRWFAQDAGLALIAPPGSLMPCTLSLHHNAGHLKALLPRLNQRGEWFLHQSFVAGSMFAARSHALAPLASLNLQMEDFEPEKSQSDGTLAHALERLVAPVVIQAGLQVRELPGTSVGMPQFGYGWASPFP